jgi:rare lipoprotein A
MARFHHTKQLLIFSLSLSWLLPLHSPAGEKEPNHDKAKSSAVSKNKAYRPQHGKASYYGKEFYGRKMADGTKMNPHSNIAASKTLPLGTVAEVTNLENGKSEVVEIRDRGPYVEGRVIDVTPKTAQELGFKEDGVVPVIVKPIQIPDSSTKNK